MASLANPPIAPARPRANILVVDDDPGNLQAVGALLEPLGQRVVRANSGAAALRELLAADFAVILIDVQMPGMDGFETAAAIKSRERTRHVPIIFLTGVSSEPGQVFSGYAQGAVDYLMKPFEPSVLRSKVGVFVELFLRGEQVKQLNAELERRVAERTRDLAAANAELQASLIELREAQEQLVHSGKMAAVGTLVAGISHELNNPLAIVLTGAQSALRRVEDEHPARPTLVAVQDAAERCGRLLRALLDFARRAPLARERVAPGQLLERVVELASARARGVGVRLELACRLDGREAPLSCCAAQVESALLHVVANAIDAAGPDGAVLIEARGTGQGLAPGVEIAVSDTGPGIPSGVLPRIFEPFFSTKPAGDGAGLGLALARQIAEAHDGRLWVESAPGAGTTMRLWLPLSCGDTAAPPRLEPRSSRPTPALSDTFARVDPLAATTVAVLGGKGGEGVA